MTMMAKATHGTCCRSRANQPPSPKKDNVCLGAWFFGLLSCHLAAGVCGCAGVCVSVFERDLS